MGLVLKQLTILKITSLSILAVGTVAVLLYANTFQAPFIYDDGVNITNNPRIRMTELSWGGIVDVLDSRSVNSTNRPFPALTIALNYYFHQYQVAGYHAVNLFIHVITAVLFYLLTRQTLAVLKYEVSYIPLLASLLWLANPLHTQSVTYIIQRMNSLAVMFYLMTMVCYIQARRLQLYGKYSDLKSEPRTNNSIPVPGHYRVNVFPFFLLAAGTASAVLALASKEIAVTLPLMIFVYEWFFFQHMNWSWLKQKILWLGGGVILIIVIALIYLDADPIQKILSSYEHKPFTPGQRLLSQPAVVIYYISLMVFPHPGRLHLIYDFPLSESLCSPMTTGLSIISLFFLVCFAVYAARKHRLISFAIVWFLGTLVIESSIFGLALIFEHRTYLPSIFPFVAGAWWLLRYGRPRSLIVAVVIISVIICSIWVRQRNHVWQDEIRFWQDAVAKTPLSKDGNSSLGQAFLVAGEYQQALPCFERVLPFEANELYAFTAANVGNVLIRLDRFQEAIPYLEKVVERNILNKDTDGMLDLALPDDTFAAHRVRELYKKAYLDLGVALQQTGKTDDAIQNYRCALGVDPQVISAWNNMGNAFFSQGNADQAVDCFKKALAIDPGYEQAKGNIRKIEMIMNKYDGVIEELETEIERQPDNALPLFQLGRIYQAIGMTDKAIRQYNETLVLDPEMTQCLNVLAGLYYDTRQIQKAVEILAQLTKLLPDNPTISYNLACLYARQNKVGPAVAALKQAVENGYNRWSHLKSDPDLANIRQTPYYRKLVSLTPQ